MTRRSPTAKDGRSSKRPTKRRVKRTAKGRSAVTPRNPNRPFWVPEGEDLDFVPPEVQQAVTELIEPVYQQSVVGAASGLEKSLGVTITHLLWLEILEQFDFKQEYTQIESVLGVTGNRQGAIAQHLRLIDSKLRIGHYLLRLDEWRRRQARQAEEAVPLPEADSLPPNFLIQAAPPRAVDSA